MTRIVGKIHKKTKENKENKGAASGSAPPGRCRAPEVVFFDFRSIFVYFANNPSHWDGNPGIGIVNPNNPKQSQFRQKPVGFTGFFDISLLLPSSGHAGMIATYKQASA